MKAIATLTLACCAMMSAAPAFAQSGSTGGVPSPAWGRSQQVAPGGALPNAAVVDLDRIPNLEQRRGPGQTPEAMMKTSLLNALSASGFQSMRGLRRAGNGYVADVMNSNGQWMTVALDPNTGTIRVVE